MRRFFLLETSEKLSSKVIAPKGSLCDKAFCAEVRLCNPAGAESKKRDNPFFFELRRLLRCFAPRNDISLIFQIPLLFIFVNSTVHSQINHHGTIREACLDCHTTNGWHVLTNPMKFDHNSTSFVLYGQHRNTECRNCHKNLKFVGTPRTCVSCHKKEYDAAIVLNHMNAAFGMECMECHSTSASSWQGSFDHNKTQFQTRGAHEAVACNTCHVNNRFRGTPIQCFACHQKEYTATTDPPHVAGFPTDCALCHRALSWRPASLFPHGAFPIASGDRHRSGVWNSCNDCHTVKDYKKFECINCHAHEKATMDSEHRKKSGYVYQSSSCYKCHPRGEEDGD